MPAFPLDAYLERIGWSGPLPVDPATLAALHRSHALAIPFENIDPLCGQPISLEPDALVAKMLHRRRGGYCYEQNGLFLLALASIGFRTVPLCARVLISEGKYAARTHQLALVEFAGARWLADVGFGGNGLVEAIPFELECEFDQKLDRFRIVADAAYGYRLEHRLPTGWRALYAFSLDPFLPADFHAQNYFVSRAPESFFTRIPICIRTTLTERRIVIANRYKVRPVDGPATVTILETADDLRRTLADELDLPLPEEIALPAPSPIPDGMREI